MIRRTALRLVFAATTSFGLLGAGLPVTAADVTMNLGFGAPENSFYANFGKIFKTKAEEMSGGAIEVKLRCCNQISSEDEAFKAMQLGTVDGFFITANNVSPHWPLMDVTVLPYIFQNTRASRPCAERRGRYAMMKEKLQSDTSVHLLAFGPGALPRFLQFRPPDQHHGRHGRPEDPRAQERGDDRHLRSLWSQPGATGLVRDTPTALQTGTVDGGDNGTSFIRDMKFYEFEPHLVILEHFVAFAPLFASDNFMSKLTDEQRTIILDAASAASDEFAAQVAASTDEIRTWLVEEGGMAMTRPDKTDFIKAAQGVQQEFAEKRGADFVALVNAIQAAAE